MEQGIEHEGEDQPAASEMDRAAISAYNALANGMGGVDWAGLDVIAEALGVDDVEQLIDSIITIKMHASRKH